MLRWGYYPEAKTARKTKRGKTAHEAGRARRDSAGSVFGAAASQRCLADAAWLVGRYVQRQNSGGRSPRTDTTLLAGQGPTCITGQEQTEIGCARICRSVAGGAVTGTFHS